MREASSVEQTKETREVSVTASRTASVNCAGIFPEPRFRLHATQPPWASAVAEAKADKSQDGQEAQNMRIIFTTDSANNTDEHG